MSPQPDYQCRDSVLGQYPCCQMCWSDEGLDLLGKIGPCVSDGKTLPQHDWRETELGCYDCGDHSGFMCYRCYDAADTVYDGDRYEWIERLLEIQKG